MILQRAPPGVLENVPDPAFMEEARRRTGLKWNRSRFDFELRVEPDVAELILTGLYYADEAKWIRAAADFSVKVNFTT